MFPCLPTRGNIAAETKCASQEAKMFPIENSETFDVSLCFSLMFPSVCPLWETWRNIGRKHCCGNICDSFSMFPQMFPCLPTRGNIAAETKCASQEAKMFPIENSETFDVSLCFSLMFPSVCPLWETWRNIGRKHCCGNICDSFSMFPQMFPCLPTRGNIAAETKCASQEAKMFPIENSETFDVSLCFSLMFPSVCPLWETWRNIGRKHCCGNICDSFSMFPQMFPCLPTRGNIVAETKFASREAKMLPIPNSETFDVSLYVSH